MKEFRFKIFMILFFIGFCLYLLFPTYSDYKNTQELNTELSTYKEYLSESNPTISEAEIDDLVSFREDSLMAADPSIKDAREKRVKLGLDLQGGMYLVMEVNTGKLLEKLARDKDAVFDSLLKEASDVGSKTDENLVTLLAEKLKVKNIRLSRYFGNIREDDQQIIDRLLEQESDAVTRAIEIIGNRVNQYGVSEPNIQKQGARRIIVELPGVAKEEEAKQLLQGRALLEFKLVKEKDFVVPIMNKIDETLAEINKLTDSTEVDTSLAFEDMTDEEIEKLHPFFFIARLNQNSPYADAYVNESDKSKLLSSLNNPAIQNIIPDNVEFVFGAKPINPLDEGEKVYRLFLVNKAAELTGGVIEDAQANIDPSTTSPIVSMTMNSEGAREWSRITGANINKRIGIVLDGLVYSAPNVISKITRGRSQIEGMADMEEAKLLEIVLKAGALPAPIDIIEERTIGPSLGQDSINQGFFSTLFGFLIVAVFMILYYKKAGTVSDLALFFTIVFIMGILAGFKATLTLPGIAGIILTIGMAVDANVLIYERIREEFSTGKTIKASIESGFVHSYSAIFDSNITTFFTGIILYQFGSGPIQGFALTLMIGIICSLFSALVVTRLVLDIMAAKGSKINLG